VAIASVVFLARSSNAPAQPTQNRYSTSGSIVPSTTGISKSSSVIQSARRAWPIPHGSPLFSRFRSMHVASTGNADSISTWWRRIPSMWSMCSMSTGHSSTHAPQLVHDQITSGSITPTVVPGADQRPVRLGPGHVRQLGPLLIREGQQQGGLGERVVAQVEDDLLGDNGLPVAQAGHCDWHRPHSVRVAISSRPFQVKSSILPSPNTSASGSAPRNPAPRVRSAAGRTAR